MANVSVYNMEGSEVGKMDLNDNVFAAKVNEHLMHMAVVLQLANKRQGTQRLRLVQRSEAVEESLGDRREQVMQDRVLQELRSGQAAESFSLQLLEITLSR